MDHYDFHYYYKGTKFRAIDVIYVAHLNGYKNADIVKVIDFTFPCVQVRHTAEDIEAAFDRGRAGKPLEMWDQRERDSPVFVAITEFMNEWLEYVCDREVWRGKYEKWKREEEGKGRELGIQEVCQKLEELRKEQEELKKEQQEQKKEQEEQKTLEKEESGQD